ncbi:ABC transporter substrate-binding protein [Paenibacillus polymyxa]|uniref:ABC transporter substrate-binding protein n=1 Tax=Paenibacillus polymyxa TaxID=1406 RepID=UPI002AB35B47|nr:ABC transporter substrate-binding protein [Paenibacillus polymyxa]MDY8022141.1 ABC transporter substrate-binding protein [Paenibacillus polymyxa]
MMQTKKWVSLLMVLTIVGVLFAGCSGGANEAQPQQGNADNKTEGNEGSAPVTEGVIKATDLTQNPPGATNRKDNIVVGMTSPKGVFNPLFWQTSYDLYVVRTVFDSFLQVKADGTYENSLADKVDVSSDGLKYTFHLKPGVKYSDGTPVTVKDYAFVLKVLHDPNYDGETDVLSFKIKGGKEYHDGKANDISGIKVIDDNTVEVTVTEATAYTKDFLGEQYFMPEAYYGKGFKKGNLDSIKALNNKPIGSGQYVLKSFSPGQQVVFDANPNYFKGAPKVKSVIFKTTTEETNLSMLQTGETDIDNVTVTEDNVEELKSLGFLDVNIMPTNGYGYIAFNHKEKKFQDPKVRQALTIGLNRKEIVQGVYGPYANVINIPQSTEAWSYTDEGIEKYEFDTAKAKALLDEAGWKVGADGIREKDGEKLTINFSATADNPVVEALLPIMSNNYKELGIKLTSETLDFNAIMDKKDTGKFDMFFAAWGLTPDPDTTTYITNGAQNDIGYSNKKVDELTLAGKHELDQEKRKLIYKQLYQELNKDLPAIFMYQRRDMWPVNGRVSGLEITPYKDFEFTLHNAQIAQ